MTEGEGSNGRKWEIRVAKQAAQVDESVSSLSEIESEDAYSHCSSNNTGEDSTHGYHQMANTEIRLTIFFAAKDGEILYSQPKQHQELIVAQIMNCLWQKIRLE